jgi:predicted nucleotidyltransferase
MTKPNVRNDYLLHVKETSRQSVLNILFRYPEKEFSLSDLAKEAGVAKANIGHILDELIRNDLIEVKKLTKIWRIKAKQQSWYFIRNKIIHNMNFIYNSGIVEFIYEHFKHPKAIVLFGSFRKGEDISESDIDIAIERDEGEYVVTRLKELSEFENLIKRRIHIHLFNRKNVDINVFNNIANGIVLMGFLEVKP